MEKEILKKLEKKLKDEKEKLKKQLKQFAKEEKKTGWKTTFPKFNGGESGSGTLEKGADEVEEYVSLLTLTQKLEKKLEEINAALKKIKEGNYGICEKCKKEIELERLMVCPEAKFCLKCEKAKK